MQHLHLALSVWRRLQKAGDEAVCEEVEKDIRKLSGAESAVSHPRYLLVVI